MWVMGILCSLAFVAVFAFCCLVAWAGGYNFDTRNADVSFMLVLSTAISGAGSFMTGLLIRSNL